MVAYFNGNYNVAVTLTDAMREFRSATNAGSQLVLRLAVDVNFEDTINYLLQFVDAPISTIEIYKQLDRKNLIATYELNAPIATLREHLEQDRIVSAIIDY